MSLMPSVSARLRAEPKSSSSELEVWLQRSRRELEFEGTQFGAVLERHSSSELAEVGSRLLRLLDDPTFGRRSNDRAVALRLQVIEAVLAAGYPWALELGEAELEFRRLEHGLRERRHRSRRLQVLALVALVVVAGAGVFAAWRSNELAAQAARERQRSRQPIVRAPLQASREVDAAPVEVHADLLISAMYREEKLNRPREVVSIGLDCLSLAAPEASRCLRALEGFSTRVLETSARPDDRTLAGDLERLVALHADPRQRTRARAVVAALREAVAEFQPRFDPAVERARAFAVARVLEAASLGELEPSWAAAEACVGHFPEAIECHRVWLAWWNVVRQPYWSGSETLFDRAEREREAIARLLIKQHAGCSPDDPERPLGCP